MVKLPEEYLERMKVSLSGDYEAFLRSYEMPPEKALRFNTRRVREETREQLIREWKLTPVPWCSDGYYYSEDVIRPGLSPYHDAGVFYIQEPSAMITAACAGIKETDLVLDLCAAPGGKSTQAAAKAGVLLSNEPVAGRARILSSNIERMGLTNTVVTSAWPGELSEILTDSFDCIIVDAPCSGEGMMRKDEIAVSEWSPANVALCIARQQEILEAAAGMLKPGGRLVYSTCTFEYGENEGQVRHFMENHPGFRLLEQHMMYPHVIRGEGHFCAVMQKDGVVSVPSALPDPAALAAMLKKKRIHVLRAGLERGETKQDRKGNSYYTPSHAEAMARVWDGDPGPKINIQGSDVCLRYLRGETLSTDAPGLAVYGGEGWLTVYYDRYPLGLGKRVGGIIKNHYPKGLRRMS